jgi:starch synthase (maltosyl-transferring)
MPLHQNDEYTASFPVERLGRYQFRVRAWIDRFGTWQDLFRRRVKGGEAEKELKSELLDGADLLRQAASHASGPDAQQLAAYADAFEAGDIEQALDPVVLELARRHDPREGLVESATYPLLADPALARHGAWYEFFPRSARGDDQHATLDDAAERLPRIKELGFDIVYLPPIHPIGTTHRKGKDNAPTAGPDDPGSPWAIGGDRGDGTKGGHKSVHPELGGIEAFDRFVARANELGLEVALDIAFQTSPDHPYVEEHPEWFKHRPDGTIRYAENPPKKYQDVYPINFETEDWKGLWMELRSVFEHWIDHGVTIFRVDNPHTKPLAFWEWCIRTLREEHPEVIFLSEAFTRPKTMYHLAKIGFNNSYTYFAWRNSKHELEAYAEELFQTEVADFFRPNFWPNTPDILTDYLVHGGRPAHVIRFVLAATLSSVYGIYGPPYEHVDNRQHPKREEYAQNEKYEIRTWNWHDPDSLQPLIKRVNRIRKENPALLHLRNLEFHPIDNPQILAYAKSTPDNLILCVVNLDPYNTQSGWLHLPLDDLGLDGGEPYEVHDLLGGERFLWNGPSNYVELNPHVMPAHIFRIHRHRRTERDFEYFM